MKRFSTSSYVMHTNVLIWLIHSRTHFIRPTHTHNHTHTKELNFILHYFITYFTRRPLKICIHKGDFDLIRSMWTVKSILFMLDNNVFGRLKISMRFSRFLNEDHLWKCVFYDKKPTFFSYLSFLHNNQTHTFIYENS